MEDKQFCKASPMAQATGQLNLIQRSGKWKNGQQMAGTEKLERPLYGEYQAIPNHPLQIVKLGKVLSYRQPVATDKPTARHFWQRIKHETCGKGAVLTLEQTPSAGIQHPTPEKLENSL
ncbi:hypothetical protein CHUAL_009502 [Chamberlinius hualienensis]